MDESGSEEALDFLIGGEIADREGELIQVEVWDNTFVSNNLVRYLIRALLFLLEHVAVEVGSMATLISEAVSGQI